MTTTFRSALLAAVALVAALPVAWAQTASPPAAPPAAGPPAATGQPSGQPARGPGGAMFDTLDGNKDNRVTWDEAWNYVQRRFATADADRDGGLTRQEADALRPAWGSRRAEGGAAPAAPPPQPSPEQAARRSRFGDMMFRSIDANRDGRVTLEEVRPMIEARFRGLDADGDNAVARSELPQRREGGRHNREPGQGSQGQGGQNQSGQGQSTPAPAAPR